MKTEISTKELNSFECCPQCGWKPDAPLPPKPQWSDMWGIMFSSVVGSFVLLETIALALASKYPNIATMTAFGMSLAMSLWLTTWRYNQDKLVYARAWLAKNPVPKR